MLNWIRKHRPRRRNFARRIRPWLESLEQRDVPAALQPGLVADAPLAAEAKSASPAFVYTETNDPQAGQNAVLAFLRNPQDGSLTPIGRFNTGGTGQANPNGALGPDDSSQEVVATPDGKFLFAVNQGSNSISAFRIERDGGLRLIGTFDSSGVQPNSIGIAGNKLYVSNRGDATSAQAGTVAPNITGFRIEGNGRLKAIADATVTFPIGTSPSQNLITPDGRFLFADIFGFPGDTTPQDNTFAPFRIERDGTLKLAPGGNVGANVNPDLLLGAAFNPNQRIIYAGLTGANQIGVFTYDNKGDLTFQGSSADQGIAACWITVSSDGKYLYAATTGSDSVGVFSLADPLHPQQIQEFTLGGPQAAPDAPPGTRQTADFQIALSPDGHSLYVIGQATNAGFADGNQLHTLSVGSDGKLSEPNGPILFSAFGLPGNAHPQGLAVVAGRFRGDDGKDFGDGGRDSARTAPIDAVFASNAAAAANGNAGTDNNFVSPTDSGLTDLANALIRQRRHDNPAG